MTATLTRLHNRDRILRVIRQFFWSRDFLEVETPILLAQPSQEPHLEPMRTTVRDYRGEAHNGFLRMSPEFSIKKLLPLLVSLRGARATKQSRPPANGIATARSADLAMTSNEEPRGVFEIGPVFRDGEPWGGAHNPEFTMLEWYRLGATYRDLMRDCEALIGEFVRNVGAALRGRPRSGQGLAYQGQTINCAPSWERLTMRRAWQRYARLDLDQLLSRAALARVCSARGYSVQSGDTFDDLFFKIHLTEVEPKLGRSKPTFLIDWPTQMAALARKKPRNSRYAERVELYIGGLEIANGFSELTDADEQLARFRSDQRLRKRLGRPAYPIDRDFIAALRKMPPTAGVALGVDRLVMLLLDAATIDEVRWLPAPALFEHRKIKTLNSKS
ncbi:MAG: amino acid--tRNA ligase-related protein [Candidatus Uhrbacteria bacterium]